VSDPNPTPNPDPGTPSMSLMGHPSGHRSPSGTCLCIERVAWHASG